MNWEDILKEKYGEEKLQTLLDKVDEIRKKENVFPEKEDVFSAFKYTPYENVKVVILGQDPYHGKGQANGLAFSVKDGVKLPPSLRNIYKEMSTDLGIDIPNKGNLIKLAREGVLLLNTTLTVTEKSPGSHKNIGWEELTDIVIKEIDKKKQPCVFILWGKHAQEKEKLLKNKNHLVLKAPHPSPLSAYRGFFGQRPFSKTNKFLSENGISPVDWRIN